MKQIEVSILGQAYVLGCPEGGEALLRAAVASVDREMVGIRDAGKVKARERIAVLAALNLAYQLAERGGAPAAPAPGPSPASAAATASNSSTPLARDGGADAVDLDALIHRVDQVLADDGRLL